VYDVHNAIRQEVYERAKQQMLRKYPTIHEDSIERRSLYHGTSWENVSSILANGFNASLSGSVNGQAYGHGVYLATAAGTSMYYSSIGSRGPNGEFALLICSALVGRVQLGSSYSTSTEVVPGSDMVTFDSYTDSFDIPKMYVIPDGSRLVVDSLVLFV
jgi:hypothetical protein